MRSLGDLFKHKSIGIKPKNYTLWAPTGTCNFFLFTMNYNFFCLVRKQYLSNLVEPIINQFFSLFLITENEALTDSIAAIRSTTTIGHVGLGIPLEVSGATKPPS